MTNTLRPRLSQYLLMLLGSVFCLAAHPQSLMSQASSTYTSPFMGQVSNNAYQCMAPKGGNPNSNSPCASSAPATLTSSVNPNLGAGNPINVLTGNKYQQDTDMPALPGVLGLEIIRHYNSAYSRLNSPKGLIGRGWKLSYETNLYVIGHTLQILQADGSRLIFNHDPVHPSLCSSSDPLNGSLLIESTSRGDEYRWTWPNGRVLHFNAMGKLESIRAPTGEFVTLTYDRQGWLLKVTDPQGRSLQMNYLDPHDPQYTTVFHGIQSIDSPVGRFTYHYGSTPLKHATASPVTLAANLVKVDIPTHYDAKTLAHPYANRGVTSSSISRIYHYEDPRFPTLLTGISVLGTGSDGILKNTRLSTWAYNPDGKAILSVKGDRNSRLERVELDFSQSGVTTLTNSLGQKTLYHYTIIDGQYRLLEVRGAGCATCGESNQRYGYDSQGRLLDITHLNNAGQPIETLHRTLDSLGRILTVSRITYSAGASPISQALIRYEYAENHNEPTMIAKPSVVPDKEHQIQITYNHYGQPLTITETGWSPSTIQPLQSPLPSRERARVRGQPNSPSKLSRTTTYTYHQINGRSVLVQIDGPLKNGPKADPSDSDITQFTWDNRADYLSSTRYPGNTRTLLQRDEAGRITRITDDEHTSTHLLYDAKNQLTSITHNGLTQRFLYDALGQRTETGSGQNKSYRANTRYAFDAAGNLLWTASHLGILERNRFDTESHLIAASTQSAHFNHTQTYAYDAMGRITAIHDNTGSTQHIRYNAQNQPETLTDSLHHEQHRYYNALNQLSSITEIANPAQKALVHFEYDQADHTSSVTAPNGAITHYIYDDFNRKIATLSPDSGLTTYTFNATDQLIASRDANHNQASYSYDPAGRINQQTITDASGHTFTTHWLYQGHHLIALEHPNQDERYRYNTNQELITKTTVLKQPGNTKISSITHYGYDTQHQLTEQTLPDGSTLIYRRNGQNQIVALERSRIRTPWLRWLLPTQTIVKNIERDIIDLKSMTYGNGIEALYQRSPEGVLARIVYRTPQHDTAHPSAVADIGHTLGVTSAQAAPPPTPFKSKGPGALGLAADPQALMDHRYLWDTEGNLLLTNNPHNQHSYAYDAQNHLIMAIETALTPSSSTQTRTAKSAPATQPDTQHISRYFYDPSGNRLLAQENIANAADTQTNTIKSAYQPNTNRWIGTQQQSSTHYDASGQPIHIQQREYGWNALGQLETVHEHGHILARYTYNHRGERIAKTVHDTTTYTLHQAGHPSADLNTQGRITRQYIYLADQPVALIDTPQGMLLNAEERSTFWQAIADIRTAFKYWFSDPENLIYLHTNHLGAPELATDEQAQPIWQAHYSPFGKADIQRFSKRFTLDLRLPGQMYDEETGLHYNYHRYYDPERGQYLTPDPLGLRGGINSYTYAASNPIAFIDPSGLILFAFDGTGNNSNPNSKHPDYTNVWLMDQYYDKTAEGQDYEKYQPGLGTNPNAWKITNTIQQAIATKGHDFVKTQLDNFAIYAKKPSTSQDIVIDIIGFSRGAALARDFANQLIKNYQNHQYGQHCLEFRFLGLFDTVSQFGPNGSRDDEYDFSISSRWENVAQAYALNEHRSLFPLRTIQGSPAPYVEKGFVGAHADIGGGYNAKDEPYRGDLSDVALNWMIQQAQNAGVKFKPLPDDLTVVSTPVVHDERNTSVYGERYDAPIKDPETDMVIGTRPADERSVIYPNGSRKTQTDFGGTDPRYGPLLEGLIQRPDGWQYRSDDCAGQANMAKYREWLKDNYDLTIQAATNEGTTQPCTH